MNSRILYECENCGWRPVEEVKICEKCGSHIDYYSFLCTINGKIIKIRNR